MFILTISVFIQEYKMKKLIIIALFLCLGTAKAQRLNSIDRVLLQNDTIIFTVDTAHFYSYSMPYDNGAILITLVCKNHFKMVNSKKIRLSLKTPFDMYFPDNISLIFIPKFNTAYEVSRNDL